jgi:Trk K+ transport system NAD-binding subunit
MKSLVATLITYFSNRKARRNIRVVLNLLLVFALLVLVFSICFHDIMALEGQHYSWITGLYWTLVVMSTLGFGDITFSSDLGRLFSVVVLLSGTVFMLILLPFTFIQFFFIPWMDAQAAARAPRSLPPSTKGHVVLTNPGPIETSLIRRLQQSHIPYVLLVPDLPDALQLFDQGFHVMLGDLDDPDTYRRVQVAQAALVASTLADTANTNVAFTVREISESVPIVATASKTASVDILQLAGCNRVLQLAEMLGQLLARRVLGRDAKSHVVGELGDLLIAEAVAAGTPLVGRTLRQIRLRDHANVNVIGVWNRGHFENAGPDTRIQPTSILLLAGSRAQLDDYDALFCIYRNTPAPILILGGGRVGRAVATTLKSQGTDSRIIEKNPSEIRGSDVLGDAAELEVLQHAGIQSSPSVVVTTSDDDMNVYLTIYCRRLRPDIQIIARATQERNISTLHRAGADFVLSYASMGASTIFNLLKRMDTLLLAEGLNVVRLPVPPALANRSLADSAVRAETGCNVIAVSHDGRLEINPDASQPLPPDAELYLVGNTDSESRFLARYPSE